MTTSWSSSSGRKQDPHTGKEKSLQHKPKISNLLHPTKEKENTSTKEILKKTNKYAQRKSPNTRKRIQKRIKALPYINKTRSLLTSSSWRKTNKQILRGMYIDAQISKKGAQILPLAHPALHNKIFIPAGYGKARILQILRIDDLFKPCIVQIPIQRRTPKNTHTVLPSYQTSCNNKTPRRRRRRSRNTKAGTTKETKTNDWEKKKDVHRERCNTEREREREREREKRESGSKREREWRSDDGAQRATDTVQQQQEQQKGGRVRKWG